MMASIRSAWLRAVGRASPHLPYSRDAWDVLMEYPEDLNQRVRCEFAPIFDAYEADAVDADG
jgi:hypothetical protein